MLKLKQMINKRILVKGEYEQEEYVSGIQEVEDDYIAVAVPYHQQRPLLLHKDQVVEVKIFGDGEYYVLKHKVLGKKKGTVPMYLLSLPSSAERIQQRNFVRLQIIIDIKYRMESSRKENSEWQKGKSIDISGGGVKLAVAAPIVKGKQMELHFSLPGEEEYITIKARVVRNDTYELSSGKLHCVGLEFLEISESLRDHIIAFIFTRMVQHRRLTK